MKDKLTLKPIGKVDKKDNNKIVKILDEYAKALKNLSKFSHAILFTYNLDKVSHYVTKILAIDEKKGMLIIDSDDINENSIIYDIKPYFSCEDNLFDSNVTNIAKADSAVEDIKYENDLSKDDLPGISKIKTSGIFKNIAGQGTLILDEKSILENAKEIEYAKIIWWFNRSDDSKFRNTIVCKPPYENAPECGIYATRSPIRPNPIACTLVKIVNIEDNRIMVDGFDGFDNSIIVDVLPYEKNKDSIANAIIPKWLSHWGNYKSFEKEKVIDKTVKLELSDTDRFLEEYLYDKRKHDSNTVEDVHKDVSYDSISVHNAYENNLKNINADIPKNKITVITGVSGSGKSSLAFDTIYNESNRQFLSIMDNNNAIQKPKVNELTGLVPAVGIGQRTPSLNPRSTVGTYSGISELLRSLFATIGVRHCEHCHKGIEVLSQGEIINIVEKLSKTKDIAIMPHGTEERILLDGDTEAIVKDALEKGSGAIYIIIEDNQYLFQAKLFCYHCNTIMFDTIPSMFSGNNPEYMCKTCKGLGYEFKVNPKSIVNNTQLSILDGASKWWGDLRKFRDKPNANWMRGEVLALAKDMDVDLDLPYEDLPDDFKQQLLHGSNGRKVKLSYKSPSGRSGTIERPVEGTINTLNRLIRESQSSDRLSVVIEEYVEKGVCSSCDGEKLAEIGRLTEINQTRYPICDNMSIDTLKKWIKDLELSEIKHHKSAIIIQKLIYQTQRIIDMGLGYLSLSRSMPTLSGGEIRRLQLSSQFGTNLTNMLYVLDEPTKGLHSKDYGKLMDKIKELRDKDNTIIMVEHRKEVIEQADYLIDIGKGAGKYGGEVIACGTIDEIKANKDSITGRHLVAIEDKQTKKQDKTFDNNIVLRGAKGNNLKNIDVDFPLNAFICVTGVSGSGKSSLVSNTLYPAIASRLGYRIDNCLPYSDIIGTEHVQDIILVSQKPIGRTPKSNPATYTGVFDLMRNVFAKTDMAKKLKYTKDYFAFNGKKGQCAVCNGLGQIKTPMNFMDDIWITCHACKGKRYREDILKVKYKGYNISEVLNLEVRDALELFIDEDKIYKILSMINDVGLSYIKLGQSAVTLSGGEAQRLKLAKELCKGNTKEIIYILDEPTTGLHFDDTDKLVNILKNLVEKDNTVIAIEHNTDFIKHCDCEIQLGHGGGESGGYVI